MSLRTRLVLGLLALCTFGLVAADVLTYTALRSFLYHQLDDTLQNDLHAARSGPPGSRCNMFAVAPEVYLRVVYSKTQVCTKRSGAFPEEASGADSAKAPPDLTKRPAIDKDYLGAFDQQSFNASSADGSIRYRVLIDEDGGSQTVVARPLDPVDDTLHRLLLIELIVTAAVLTAIGVLGTWVIRRELRPLERMGGTAGRIAAGDLTQRVEPAEDRTEVGRLGLALNRMLGEIEASDQRLRRFVADASHELRTPLAAVRAYAELFGRGADRRPDDLARAMAGIGRESERMSLLVDDLLLLARLDEHRPLERKPVRLDEIAGEAVDAARAVDPERPLELTAEPAIVLGDGNRLRQVLDNLLANVRSHTPAGSAASVHVSRRNGSAVLDVADSGAGLSAEEAEHVFERFYRADDSRSRASGGVGLGLAIVAAVAEAHDGSASVTSEPGRGTTFHIVLPLAGDTR